MNLQSENVTFLRQGSLLFVTKCYQLKIPYFWKLRNTRRIKFVSWALLVIQESVSYCLAGLWYSQSAYLMFICLYPFIWWLKISST